jgi:hypothetical protein
MEAAGTFFFFHDIKIGSTAHPMYQMVTRGLSPGVKWLEHKANHSFPSCIEIMHE